MAQEGIGTCTRASSSAMLTWIVRMGVYGMLGCVGWVVDCSFKLLLTAVKSISGVSMLFFCCWGGANEEPQHEHGGDSCLRVCAVTRSHHRPEARLHPRLHAQRLCRIIRRYDVQTVAHRHARVIKHSSNDTYQSSIGADIDCELCGRARNA